MVSAILLCCVLAGADGKENDGRAAKPQADLSAYQAAKDRAGQSADAHILLALWCEAHGLTAERLKHLSLAVLYDPSSALARGLMGLVAYRGKWERPEQVSQTVHNDPETSARVAAYLQRRTKTPDRAEDQWKLALWCEQNGLKQQATAHVYRVLQLDPSRDAAWKHLGFKRLGGRWDKPERVAAAKAEAEKQHKANNHWKPLLEKIAGGLASKDKARSAQAEKTLAAVDDPRAVPMIWMVFANGGVQHQAVAVRLLSQIDSPGSSRALALLALSGRSSDVRRSATQILRQRDPRDFAGVLIALLRDPIKYEVRPVKGPGSQGQLVIKRKDANIKRLYSPLAAPDPSLLAFGQLSFDASGLPVINFEMGVNTVPIGLISATSAQALFGMSSSAGAAQFSGLLSGAGVPSNLSQRLGAALARNASSSVINTAGNLNAPNLIESKVIDREVEVPIGQMMLDAQRSAQSAQAQLASDVQAIDSYNAPIVETNGRVQQILADSTGVDLAPDKDVWAKWLVDLSGYAFGASSSSYEKPTIVEDVPISYQPQAVPIVVDQPVATVISRHSCFGAGTPVRTLEGLSAIEKLRAGDEVLTQDLKTGELKYQAILTAYHNPPNATLRIELDGDKIVATGIHRFWKAGRGWVMARELKAGDALRTVGGTRVVKSVEPERVQPVFNLQVADGQSFFVGESGVLAHDNSVVNPTPNPFDAVPDLKASAAP
jgi:Pretoxin HINT domain